MLTTTFNPYKEEYGLPHESSGSSFLNGNKNDLSKNCIYYVKGEFLGKGEENNYELVNEVMELLNDIDYTEDIKRSNNSHNLISNLFNEPGVAISKALKDEIISDFNAIYNYFITKEISKFVVEFIDENELFIKIKYRNLSVYITFDYIEENDKYSVTLIRNKKIEKIINESSIYRFILALKSYLINVQT